MIWKMSSSHDTCMGSPGMPDGEKGAGQLRLRPHKYYTPHTGGGGGGLSGGPGDLGNQFSIVSRASPIITTPS